MALSYTGLLSQPTSCTPLDTALVFGLGLFQRLVLVYTTLSLIVSLSHSLISSVLARPVDHWCRPPAELSDIPPDIWRNWSIPLEQDGAFSRCTRYDPPTEAINSTTNRSVVHCTTWDYNVTTKSESIVSQWNLVCDRTIFLSLQSSLYLGASVAASFTGLAGDRVGRKPVLHASICLLVFSGGVTVFANTLGIFAILRSLTSASASTVFLMASVLLFEVTPTSHRALYSTLAISTSIAVTPLFIFLISELTGNWVVAQSVLMIPTSGLLLALYVMEESPCWLLVTGRLQEIGRAVLWPAKMNGYSWNDVQALVGKIKQEHSRRGSAKLEVERTGLLDCISDTNGRNRCIIISASWFILFFIYYDTNLGKDMSVWKTLRVIAVALKIPVMCLTVLSLHRLGRRRTLTASMMLESVLVSLEAWLASQYGSTVLIPVLVVATSCLLDVSAVTLFVFTTELYPTVLRAGGLSISFTCGRFGGLLSTLVRDSPPADRIAVLGLCAVGLLVLGLASSILPETSELRASIREAELEDKWKLRSPIEATRTKRKPRKTTKPRKDLP